MGRPTQLTEATGLEICQAVSEGCYLHVAAARVGIIPYTLYLWNERGKREAQARATLAAQGKPADFPMSVWEWFHLSLEACKAEARFNAETRVFQQNPLAWLKNGYARKDWHEADTRVIVVEDPTEKRIAEMRNAAFGLSATGAPLPVHTNGEGEGGTDGE